jgi:hypothetical protein
VGSETSVGLIYTGDSCRYSHFPGCHSSQLQKFFPVLNHSSKKWEKNNEKKSMPEFLIRDNMKQCAWNSYPKALDRTISEILAKKKLNHE